MPSIVTPRNISDVKRYRKSYSKFRGVDFSTDPTLVNDSRSPLCQNLISDLAGFPEKRLGWRTLFTVDSPINGLFYAVFESGAGKYIVHGGTKLYTFTDTGFLQVYDGMNNARSTAFSHGGKLYILDGANYLVAEETGDTIGISHVRERAFVPTTVIGAPAAGGGTPFEAVNMLTGKRINSMIGDGTSTVFKLDSENIDSVESVKIDGVLKAETTDYTVNLSDGTVTFTQAPAESAAGGGVDNVVIAFTKNVPGYISRIEKCTIAASYGYNNDNRFFLSGNPEYQNWDWQSGLDDPTYFPDTGYTKVGADTSAIMGYIKQYDTLTVIKNSNEQDAELFLRTAEITDGGAVLFPIKQGAKGVGAVSKHAFANLRDDPIFLAREGVFAITSTSLGQERALQDRSFYVNAKLTQEPNLETAVSVVWNGYYILCVNGHCYVADSRQRTGASQTEQYSYEWYYWTNIPARIFLEHSGALYFGTADGRICKFNTDVSGMARFSDDDEPIVARWSTKADTFGIFTRRKTLVKKGSGVMIKPYSRSSVKVYVATDKQHERLIRTALMDIFDFSDIDFSRFTFNTLDTPQVKPFNTKVKKFILLQLIFENDAVNEGFGVYGAEVQYTVGNYVK